MIRFLALIVCFSFVSGIATKVQAGIRTAVFDFENQPVTANGGLTSLALSRNGIGLTIDRAGQPFDIADLAPFKGAGAFGSRSLSPTPPGGNSFNVNFSTPIASFSAQFGDFTSTATDSLALTAFSGRNGTGSNLGSVFANLPLHGNGMFAFKSLQISGRSIGSVEIVGGTPNTPNSVYFDNFTVRAGMGGSGIGGGVSAVPLPAGVCVMPVCAIIAVMAGRRLRAGGSQTRKEREQANSIRERLGRRRQYSRPLHTRVTRGWDRPHLGDL